MDLNRAIVMGHVGREPTYHHMRNTDGQLCKFSVATSRKWKDKASGEQKEETQWHNIVIFNKYLVDLCERFVQKGTRVYIEGEIKTRKYVKDDIDHYITEIAVPQVKGELIIVEKGKGWGDKTSSSQPTDYAKPPSPDDYDDDIPF